MPTLPRNRIRKNSFSSEYGYDERTYQISQIYLGTGADRHLGCGLGFYCIVFTITRVERFFENRNVRLKKNCQKSKSGLLQITRTLDGFKNYST